jgi:hypothetical protein
MKRLYKIGLTTKNEKEGEAREKPFAKSEHPKKEKSNKVLDSFFSTVSTRFSDLSLAHRCLQYHHL